MHSILTPERWARLGPRLDELLELDGAAREARLDEWQRTEPELAAEARALLQELPDLQAEGFLEDDLQQRMGLAPERECGPWQLEQPLGSGGMGSVWLARRADGRYQAQAAVKLPHPGVLAAGGAARFEREGRLLARLSHPHIATLLDAGVTAAGQPYLVLEYVKGEPIDRHCDHARLPVARRVALFEDVLAAVAHAHAQLVLHRDLKPSNILVDAEGRVKLLDFGIARLIEGDPLAPAADASTLRAFTPDHAAPEQLQGEPVSTATDVYALGVLLYQLLAGRHPTAQPGHTPVERLRAVVDAVPPPMSTAVAADADAAALRQASPRALARTLRGDLDTIVAKALKKDPAERYSGALAFADDLRRWREGLPVLARPDSAGYRARRFVARHRGAVAAAAAGTLLLLGGAATTAWQAAVAKRERDEARWQAERVGARSNLWNLLLGQMDQPDAPLTQRQILESAARLAESRYGNQPRLAIEMLLPIAGQYATMDEPAADLRVMQTATRLAQASGDAELIALTACSTVATYVALDRLEDAEAALATGLAALARVAHPPAGLEADCLRFGADLARDRGQFARALQSAQRAREALEAGGETDGNRYPGVLSVLVLLNHENGRTAATFEALDRLQAVDLSFSGGRTLDSLGYRFLRANLTAEAGEIVTARAAFHEALAMAGDTPTGPARSLWLGLARLELAAGRTGEAAQALERTESVARGLGETIPEARFCLLHERLALATGDLAAARRWATALPAAPAQGLMKVSTHTPATMQARLRLAEGATAQAVQAIEEELARLESEGVPNLDQRAETWRAGAEIQLAAGQPARAAAHARNALDAARRAARKPEASALVGQSHLLLARVLRAQGDEAGARAEAALAVEGLQAGFGADHPLVAEARAFAAVR